MGAIACLTVPPPSRWADCEVRQLLSALLVAANDAALAQPRTTRRDRCLVHGRHLRLEPLEDRRLLAVAWPFELLKDISIAPVENGSMPGQMTEADGAIYFTADGWNVGTELWKGDCTAAGHFFLRFAPRDAAADSLAITVSCDAATTWGRRLATMSARSSRRAVVRIFLIFP